MLKIHSKTSKWLLFPGIIVMAFIYIMNYSDEWGPFALRECLFGLLGYLLVQARLGQTINPARIPLQKLPQDDRAYHTIIQFAVIMFMQFATGMLAPKYTPTIFEQAAYRVFAGPMEEMGFRAGIIILIVGNKPKSLFRICIALPIETIAFAAIHTQYYGDMIAMLTISLGGLIWGIFFVLWWDLGANMTSHFIVNAAAFAQWYLVSLSAISPMMYQFLQFLTLSLVIFHLVKQ
jgi:hypothetical protein